MGLLLIITGLRLAEKIVVLRRLHDLRKTIVQLYCNDYMPSYCGKVKISCGYQTHALMLLDEFTGDMSFH